MAELTPPGRTQFASSVELKAKKMSKREGRSSLLFLPFRAWIWMGWGPTMQPRESAPLWVWLTFGLMTVGTVMYLTGYIVIEDLLAFFK
jgi:hypothetical protein